MRWLLCFALAWLALPLQTVLLPPFFPGSVKPDLFLLLTIWLGLRASPWRGGPLVYALGWFYDAYAGVFPGLHGFVLLAVFLTVCGMATRLNTESLPLLGCLVGGATLLQGTLTVFALEFFANVEQFWVVMIRVLPAQLLCNLLAGYLLRLLYLRLRQTAPGKALWLAAGFGGRHAP
jgi:rod shape-determining protein MreD